jgi:hypothetical protein
MLSKPFGPHLFVERSFREMSQAVRICVRPAARGSHGASEPPALAL